MLVQMRTTAAGPDGVLSLGKVYDLPAEKARGFIDTEYAFPVRMEDGKPVRIAEEKKAEPVATKK